ncbi:helicase [Ignicoccus islandicus DSM 13165]|uniref:Helicase n=2 Tax=Ignicoccus islandicus TaxID=54259 RepID=A0A0U3F3B0_9CREN|nr:helicase [Ignicoccus islandicus DSM 13165]
METIKPCDSAEILRELGYSFELVREGASVPEFSNKSFDDFLKGSVARLKGLKLYKHQEEVYEAITKGKNVILVSGTGSGKTEAWMLPVITHSMKTLVIYPTLALSSDQLRRLREYFSELSSEDKVVLVDSRNPRVVDDALIVATNPAFLFQDLKRIAEGRGYLKWFLQEVELIVVDELDFYGYHGVSAIISMLELISNYIKLGDPPQLVLLTATLGSPNEMASVLREINERETVVVEGKPFKVENRTYIVYSKDLDKLWDWVQKNKSKILSKAPSLKEFISEKEKFKENVYGLIEALRSKGIWPPSPSMDYAEVIARYVHCEKNTLTLVFVSSIRMAEKLVREVRERLPENEASQIEAHHHMIPKSKREEIERRARLGEVKVIVSPKTLAQGIDIGNVVRVVHIGLPETLREFRQREGRKGRRGNIEFTESIIFPYKQWDKKLLRQGLSVLTKWISMPLEKVDYNPSNKWNELFVGLWKSISGYPLLESEKELLEELNLINDRGILTAEGRKVWNYLGFYEYGPPYGIPRVLYKGGRKERLPEIGRRDFIERFQPGSFDYSNDAVVVGYTREGIVEKPLSEAIRESEWLFEAVQQYYKIKEKWGEFKPDVTKDYKYGKLSSKVEVLANPPKNGFGRLTEVPLRTYWIVESRKADVKKLGNNITLIYNKERVALAAETHGEYEDYTYGFSYTLDPVWEDYEVSAAVAFGLAALRVKDNIDVTEFAYAISSRYGYKELIVWEREASGILQKLGMERVKTALEEVRIDKLLETLALMIDSESVELSLKKATNYADLKKKLLNVFESINAEPSDMLIEMLKTPCREGSATAFIYDDSTSTIYISDNGEFKSIKVEKPKDLAPLADIFRRSKVVVTFMPPRKLERLVRTYPLLYKAYLEGTTKNSILNMYNILKNRLRVKWLDLNKVAEKLGMELSTPRDALALIEELYFKWQGYLDETAKSESKN